MNIVLKEITPDNWRLANKLKVYEHQTKYVASCITILAKAYAYRNDYSIVYAIYNESEPVGLLMQRDYRKEKGLSCILDQFMIDKRFQRRGYAREAMQIWLELVKASNRYISIDLCYIEDDQPAKNLYLSLGFIHTNENEGNEITMEYLL